MDERDYTFKDPSPTAPDLFVTLSFMVNDVKLTLPAFPAHLVLLLLTYLLHPRRSPRSSTPSPPSHPSRPPSPYTLHLTALNHQIFHLLLSLLTGLYLMHITNTSSYYAVMKRAPPLGTLWVWSVIEMRLGWAVGSLVFIGGVGWVRGYTIF